MVYLFFDTETSGLMKMDFKGNTRKKGYPDPKSSLSSYDSCRLVSICWLVSRREKIMEQAYFIIRPDHQFLISEESTKIHGITQEQAESEGNSLSNVLLSFVDALHRVDSIIGHNVDFDYHVLYAELIRANMYEAADILTTKKRICTMLVGRQYLGVDKYPKLTELYFNIFNKELTNAHDALADTMACFKCFLHMCPHDKGVFFLNNKKITLTKEQVDVVYENPEDNILVFACAGSGKTLTMLARIQWLLESKNAKDPSEIMLMTFTWDAAQDMKKKLTGLLGYEPTGMKLGTIDGISKCFLETYSTDNQLRNVGELSLDFYSLLQSSPFVAKHIRYLFVDEIQDINETQFKIIKTLHDRCGMKVFAVGDDAQNIYGFRGSNVKHMQNMSKLFPQMKIKYLSINFRSTSGIVSAANSCLARMKTILSEDRPIMTSFMNDDSTHGPIVKYCGPDNQTQVNFIIRKIQLLTSGQHAIPLHEIAILCMKNKALFKIEEGLIKNNINCTCLERKTNNNGRIQKSKDAVCLSTIHKAKGMEWRIVFIINMSEPVNDIDELDSEEQRRLFYVGITRAREGLMITYCAPVFSPRVIKFISETKEDKVWTFKGMNSECFSSKSNYKTNSCSYLPPITITNALQFFRGETYNYLRNNTDWIPEFQVLSEENNQNPRSNETDLLFKYAWLFWCVTYSNSKDNICNMTMDARRVLSSDPPLDNDKFMIFKRYEGNLKQEWGIVDPFPPSKHVIQERDRMYYNEIKNDMLNRSIRWNLEDPSLISLTNNDDAYPKEFINRIKETLHNFDDETKIYEKMWDLCVCHTAIRDYRRRMVFQTSQSYDQLRSSIIEKNHKHLINITRWCKELSGSWESVHVDYPHPWKGRLVNDNICLWAKEKHTEDWSVYVPLNEEEIFDVSSLFKAHLYALLSSSNEKYKNTRWCYLVDLHKICTTGRLYVYDIWQKYDMDELRQQLCEFVLKHSNKPY